MSPSKEALIVVPHAYLDTSVLDDELRTSGISGRLDVAWRKDGIDPIDAARVVAVLQMDHEFGKAAMDRYPNLRFVSLLMTGTDQFDAEHAAKRKIAWSNVSGYATQAVAELNLLLALGALRRVTAAVDGLRAGRFDDCGAGRELGFERVGIVGVGTIGLRTAELLRPFGCPIAGWSKSRTIDEAWIQPMKLDELLQKSTVVFVQAKLVKGGNESMIGARELALLPDGAVVVNAARAGLIDEAAFRAELRSGRISAGLDVHYEERAGKKDELWSLPNVFALPHIGFKAKSALAELARRGAGNVATWLRGRGC